MKWKHRSRQETRLKGNAPRQGPENDLSRDSSESGGAIIEVEDTLKAIRTCEGRLQREGRPRDPRDAVELQRLIEIYLQAAGEEGLEELDRAVEVLASSGEAKRAARLAEKFGRFSVAASLYEKCGRLREAADLYERASEPVKAAQILERLRDLYRSALLYERSPATISKSAEIFRTTLVATESWRETTRYPVLDIAASEQAGVIAAGLSNGTAMLLSRDGAVIWKLRLPEGVPATSVSLSRQANLLAIGSEAGALFVCDGDKKILWEHKVASPVYSVSLAPLAELLAEGCDDGSVRLYNARKGKVLWEFTASFSVWSVSTDREGKKVVAGSGDQCLYVLGRDGKLLQTREFDQWVHSVDWSPDGKYIVAGVGWNRVILLANEGREIVFEETLDWPTHSVKFSPDAKTFAVAADEKALLFGIDGKLRWSKSFDAKAYRVIPAGPKHFVVGFEKEGLAGYVLKGLARRAARNYERCEEFGEAAKIYQELGEFDRAHDYYVKAGDLEGEARMLERLGKKREAIEKYLVLNFKERAAELAEELGDFEQAIRLYHELGRGSKAAALSERVGDNEAAASRYRDSGEFGRAAQIYEKIGLKDDALECYRKYLAHKPEEWESAMRFAHLLMEKGDHREAIQVLQRLISQEEYRRESLLMLARCFSSERLYDIAISRYEEYLGKDARVSAQTKEPFYELALLYETVHRYDRAEEIFRELLATDYEFKDVRDRLEKIKELQSAYAGVTSPGAGEKTVLYQEFSPEFKTRYQVVKKLGEGGMGSVFMAKDTRLGRMVALKVIRPQFLRDERFRVRFLREARLAASMQHPNIVQVFDAGAEEDRHYIAMEYIEGESLQHIIQKGPLPIRDALRIALQVVDALAHAHKNGIIHRDIKPANIMIASDTGLVKVMDFGLARAEKETRVTATGAILGSWLYMSPEQAQGQTVDARSDIYAFGTTLYEALVGKPPFVDGDLAFHHVHTPPRPPVELRPEIPQALNELILSCLAKEAEHRPQSAEEIRDSLQRIMQEIS